jgi:hypothetical protein
MGRHSKPLEKELWHTDYWNVVMVAQYLVQEKFWDADELIHFIEKPWHYDEMYDEAENFYDQRKFESDANKINIAPVELDAE